MSYTKNKSTMSSECLSGKDSNCRCDCGSFLTGPKLDRSRSTIIPLLHSGTSSTIQTEDGYPCDSAGSSVPDHLNTRATPPAPLSFEEVEKYLEEAGCTDLAYESPRFSLSGALAPPAEPMRNHSILSEVSPRFPCDASEASPFLDLDVTGKSQSSICPPSTATKMAIPLLSRETFPALSCSQMLHDASFPPSTALTDVASLPDAIFQISDHDPASPAVSPAATIAAIEAAAAAAAAAAATLPHFDDLYPEFVQLEVPLMTMQNNRTSLGLILPPASADLSPSTNDDPRPEESLPTSPGTASERIEVQVPAPSAQLLLEPLSSEWNDGALPDELRVPSFSDVWNFGNIKARRFSRSN